MLELFKLAELPFRLTPDPAFLYLSKNHARAKAYMESTIWHTDGFVIITGEIGSGKTTLIETFLHEAGNDVVVAQINQTQLSSTEFLQALLVQFGIDPFKMKKVELLTTLNGFLIEQYDAGRRVLIVVDEAQNLSLKVLEEVRLLSGLETSKDKVMRIILAGQPELNQKLDRPELAQLTQRVRLRFHLTPLSREDTDAYIKHRLDVAGSGGREIFLPDTFPVIFQYTGGVPRLINTLCDSAMMSAFAMDQDTVNLETIMGAVGELRWSEYTERSNQLAAYRQAMSSQAGFQSTGVLPEDIAGEDKQALARIVLTHKGENRGEFVLGEGTFLIGRTRENDMQIESRFVSRHHAQIITTEAGSVIEDLNSTNGIAYQGKRVLRRTLNDGDVIRIGEHILSYMDDRNFNNSLDDTQDGDDSE